MKIISLMQPWATLVAIGAKEIETRSWATKYRGKLGIHASAKFDPSICYKEPFKTIFEMRNIKVSDLPTGAIIAVTEIKDCLPILAKDEFSGFAMVKGHGVVTGNEYCFGDYTPGRYAWILSRIPKRIEPIKVKGQLNLWEYPLEV